MKVSLLAAAGVAIALPAAAAAVPPDHGEMSGGGSAAAASIDFAAFAPPKISALVGDTVTWRNRSLRAHTVTAEDGTFDSRRLASGETFTRRFDAAGVTAYYCRLHTFMRGEVDVHRVLLDAPTEPTAPRKPRVLTGRAAVAPGTRLAVQADSGAGFREVTSAAVAEGGTFTATVTPDATTRYRAVAGPDESHPVTLVVLDRKVSATASTRARRATVDAVVTPASPGATVVLQLKLRHRFGWWPVARAKVGRGGAATFRIPVGSRVPARVVLTLADGATPLATSRTLFVGR